MVHVRDYCKYVYIIKSAKVIMDRMKSEVFAFGCANTERKDCHNDIALY